MVEKEINKTIISAYNDFYDYSNKNENILENKIVNDIKVIT
jgi:hypothetical protein